MGLRSSFTLIIIGAILAFAVRADFEGLDIQVVGIILMLAGAVAMILTLKLRPRPGPSDVYPDLPPPGEPVAHDHDVDS